ncbi:MAG: thioredoxin family protein [Rhodospirillales bacterium]
MAALQPPPIDFGTPAPDFTLPDPKGVLFSRDSIARSAGGKGLLVMFICNHCPFVKAILTRLCDDVRTLQALGIGVVGINANDADSYPDDSPAKMAELSAAHDLPFPYLVDADQSVAKAYGAVCTPDFFGFDAALGLQYRGRLDAYRLEPAPGDRKCDLLDAMTAVAAGQGGPAEQWPSMGCSIKWKTA